MEQHRQGAAENTLLARISYIFMQASCGKSFACAAEIERVEFVQKYESAEPFSGLLFFLKLQNAIREVQTVPFKQ